MISGLSSILFLSSQSFSGIIPISLYPSFPLVPIFLANCESATMAEPGKPGVRTMHPAPSLGEAPPVDFTRSRLEYDLKALVSDGHSPVLGPRGTMFENRELERFSTHDTDEASHLLPPLDSATTNSVRRTSAGLLPVETTSTLANIELPRTPLKSPSKAAIQNGQDLADERRTPKGARRRTGPLNKEQRIKAAIIRKIGACQDCKRRRVSCDPARTLSSLSFHLLSSNSPPCPSSRTIHTSNRHITGGSIAQCI